MKCLTKIKVMPVTSPAYQEELHPFSPCICFLVNVFLDRRNLSVECYEMPLGEAIRN